MLREHYPKGKFLMPKTSSGKGILAEKQTSTRDLIGQGVAVNTVSHALLGNFELSQAQFLNWKRKLS
jgi:hypothetical protein